MIIFSSLITCYRPNHSGLEKIYYWHSDSVTPINSEFESTIPLHADKIRLMYAGCVIVNLYNGLKIHAKLNLRFVGVIITISGVMAQAAMCVQV